jgi:hypothetical protein
MSTNFHCLGKTQNPSPSPTIINAFAFKVLARSAVVIFRGSSAPRFWFRTRTSSSVLDFLSGVNQVPTTIVEVEPEQNPPIGSLLPSTFLVLPL